MPYKRKGKVIYHYKKRKWSIKQRCRTIPNAKKAIKFLRGLSHGMKPMKRKK